MPSGASRNPLARVFLDGVRGAGWSSVARAALWSLRRDCVPPGAPAPGAWRDLRVELPTSYDATDAEWFVQSLLRGFEALADVQRAPIPQRGVGLVIGRASAGGRALEFAIDYFDEPRIDTDVAASVDLYFKLQFLRGGYGIDRVVPGGYVQPRREPHDQFCRLRGWARGRPGASVYGRFGTQFGEGPRARAVALVEGRPGLGYSGGLGIVPYVQSLQEAARAKVCLDLPGRGPFCYRLVDYLSVGACIVAAPHPTRLHVELEDRVNIVYAREDLGDIPDLCEWLLEDAPARQRIAGAAADFFDRNLHYLPLAGMYLGTIAERLGAERAAAQ